MGMLDQATEHILIRKARQGDGAAIESLIRAYQDPLYAFMLRMSGNPEVAADIVQEAFVRVLKHLDRFDQRFRFSTWLFTIAKRLYVNAVNKHKPVYDSDRVGTEPGVSVDPNDQASMAESRRMLRGMVDKALAELSPQQREIVLLFHQQSWSISLIAEHLQMPEGTIKSHLHRARKRMKQIIIARHDVADPLAEVLA